MIHLKKEKRNPAEQDSNKNEAVDEGNQTSLRQTSVQRSARAKDYQ